MRMISEDEDVEILRQAAARSIDKLSLRLSQIGPVHNRMIEIFMFLYICNVDDVKVIC